MLDFLLCLVMRIVQWIVRVNSLLTRVFVFRRLCASAIRHAHAKLQPKLVAVLAKWQRFTAWNYVHAVPREHVAKTNR